MVEAACKQRARMSSDLHLQLISVSLLLVLIAVGVSTGACEIFVERVGLPQFRGIRVALDRERERAVSHRGSAS